MPEPRSDKNRYHHGNLRESLIQHAIALLEEEGLSALSLRRVAKEAGVSQAAPYSHFENKRDLLTAVARQGYLRFTEQMKSRAEKHDIYLVGLGLGYVEFALENPALFHLMFNSDLPELINVDETDPAFRDGYLLLVKAVADQPLDFPGERGKGLDAEFSWSLVHGISGLLMSNKFFNDQHGYEDRIRLVEDLLIRYLGLGDTAEV